MRYRLLLINYANRYWVSKAAVKYKPPGIMGKWNAAPPPKNNERFYASHTFYSFQDFSRQLQVYNRRDYNLFPMRPLGWKSPQTVLKEFIQHGVTYV